jgi:hypothetical protein
MPAPTVGSSIPTATSNGHDYTRTCTHSDTAGQVAETKEFYKDIVEREQAMLSLPEKFKAMDRGMQIKRNLQKK